MLQVYNSNNCILQQESVCPTGRQAVFVVSTWRLGQDTALTDYKIYYFRVAAASAIRPVQPVLRVVQSPAVATHHAREEDLEDRQDEEGNT